MINAATTHRHPATPPVRDCQTPARHGVRPRARSSTRIIACIGLLIIPFVSGCRPSPPEPVYTPQILQSAPHDTNAFTQGLLIDGPFWLESTGLYGQSELREVHRVTGEISRKRPLPRNLFGEGLALFQEKLYQLSWREGLCLVYDRDSFDVVGHFRYEGEGWGLTSCDTWLYMSDGSEILQVRDPATFAIVRRITVRSNQGAVKYLNELEWIDGEIWANIFQTQSIARINPSNGLVMGFVHLDNIPLPGDEHAGQDVLNGIAYDPADQSIWVTGKKWKKLYQITRPAP
jgi:glutaminyl-peptide cyclotransferase